MPEKVGGAYWVSARRNGKCLPRRTGHGSGEGASTAQTKRKGRPEAQPTVDVMVRAWGGRLLRASMSTLQQEAGPWLRMGLGRRWQGLEKRGRVCNEHEAERSRGRGLLASLAPLAVGDLSVSMGSCAAGSAVGPAG